MAAALEEGGGFEQPSLHRGLDTALSLGHHMSRVGKSGSAPRVFLSYRRDDSAGYAARLYDDLCEIFGSETLFRDVDALEPGVEFSEALEQTVHLCDAFVVVLGPQWSTSIDARGKRRLQDPHDFVRLEVEAALKRTICVLPALVQGASMPSPQDLPKALAPLIRRQACKLSASCWRYDVGYLSNVLRKSLNLTLAKRGSLSPKVQGELKALCTPWCKRLTVMGIVLAALLASEAQRTSSALLIGFLLLVLPALAIGKMLDTFLKK